MQPAENIHEYAKAVCDQIKWKKAHIVITEEIENHLIDQRNSYMADGASEITATDQAIAQMGDPVTVGAQLDRTHRPKPQWVMLALTTVIACIGIAFEIFFMGDIDGIPGMLVQFAIGLALMAAAYFIDFSWIGKRPVIIYVLLMVMFAITYALRKSENFSFYAHYAPLLFPLGFAGIVYSARNKGYLGVLLCGLAALVTALAMLLIWERMILSYFMLFAVSALVILCIAISKKWFNVKILKGYLLVLIPVAIALFLAVIIILNDSNKLERIQTAFSPSFDPRDADSFGSQIKGALAGSKFIGQGVMPDGMQEPGYNIFCILTCLIFYAGWISVIPIMGLLLLFIIKGFRLCLKQKNGLALYVSISIMMTFTMQVTSYILFNLGFDLFAPLSLPFIMQLTEFEYYANSVLIGIMLSVFRIGYIIKEKNINKIKNHSLITHNKNLTY